MSEDNFVTSDELERARVLKVLKKQGRNPNEGSRLSVMLPIVLHRQLKLKALKKGLTIREYVIELLEREGIK